MFGPLGDPVTDDPVLTPWLDPITRLGAAVETLLAAEEPFGIDLTSLAATALDDAAGHPETWGETHVLADPRLRAGARPGGPPSRRSRCPATSTACVHRVDAGG